MQEKKVHEQLLEAVEQGALDHVKELVEENSVDLDKVKNDKGLTVAMVAASHGHLPIIQYFAEVNKSIFKIRHDINGSTVLMFAAQHAQVHVARFLVEHQLNRVDDANDLGLTPLMYAGTGRDISIFDYLYECDKDQTRIIKDGILQGMTLLILMVNAGANNMLSKAYSLIEKGVISNDELASVISAENGKWQGMTALYIAIKHYCNPIGSVDKTLYKAIFQIVLQRLIENRYSLEGVAKNDSGRSWLSLAIKSQVPEILKLVIKALDDGICSPELLSSQWTENSIKGISDLYLALHLCNFSHSSDEKKALTMTIAKKLINRGVLDRLGFTIDPQSYDAMILKHAINLANENNVGPIYGIMKSQLIRLNEELFLETKQYDPTLVETIRRNQYEANQKIQSSITSSISLADLIRTGAVDEILERIQKVNPKKLDSAILNDIVVENEDSNTNGMDLLMIILSEIIQGNRRIQSDPDFYQRFAITLIHRKQNFKMISKGEYPHETIPFLAIFTNNVKIIEAIFQAARVRKEENRRIDDSIMIACTKDEEHGNDVNDEAVLINLINTYMKVSPNSDLARICKRFALYLISKRDIIDECFTSGLNVVQIASRSDDPDLIKAMHKAYKDGRIAKKMLDYTVQEDVEIKEDPDIHHHGYTIFYKGENLLTSLLGYLYDIECMHCCTHSDEKESIAKLIEEFAIDIIRSKKKLDGIGIRIKEVSSTCNWLYLAVKLDRPNIIKEINIAIQQGRVPDAVLNYISKCNKEGHENCGTSGTIFNTINHIINNCGFHKETRGNLQRLKKIIEKKLSESRSQASSIKKEKLQHAAPHVHEETHLEKKQLEPQKQKQQNPVTPINEKQQAIETENESKSNTINMGIDDRHNTRHQVQNKKQPHKVAGFVNQQTVKRGDNRIKRFNIQQSLNHQGSQEAKNTNKDKVSATITTRQSDKTTSSIMEQKERKDEVVVYSHTSGSSKDQNRIKERPKKQRAKRRECRQTTNKYTKDKKNNTDHSKKSAKGAKSSKTPCNARKYKRQTSLRSRCILDPNDPYLRIKYVQESKPKAADIEVKATQSPLSKPEAADIEVTTAASASSIPKAADIEVTAAASPLQINSIFLQQPSTSQQLVTLLEKKICPDPEESAILQRIHDIAQILSRHIDKIRENFNQDQLQAELPSSIENNFKVDLCLVRYSMIAIAELINHNAITASTAETFGGKYLPYLIRNILIHCGPILADKRYKFRQVEKNEVYLMWAKEFAKLAHIRVDDENKEIEDHDLKIKVPLSSEGTDNLERRFWDVCLNHIRHFGEIETSNEHLMASLKACIDSIIFYYPYTQKSRFNVLFAIMHLGEVIGKNPALELKQFPYIKRIRNATAHFNPSSISERDILKVITEGTGEIYKLDQLIDELVAPSIPNVACRC